MVKFIWYEKKKKKKKILYFSCIAIYWVCECGNESIEPNDTWLYSVLAAAKKNNKMWTYN